MTDERYPAKAGEGMAFEQVEKRNPKAPDFKGAFLLDGKLMELACWWREGQSAKGKWRALSYTVKPARESRRSGTAPAAPPDDEPQTEQPSIPF